MVIVENMLLEHDEMTSMLMFSSKKKRCLGLVARAKDQPTASPVAVSYGLQLNCQSYSGAGGGGIFVPMLMLIIGFYPNPLLQYQSVHQLRLFTTRGGRSAKKEKALSLYEMKTMVWRSSVLLIVLFTGIVMLIL